MRSLALLLAVASAAPRATQGQDWSRYRPGTLAPIMQAHDAALNEPPGDTIPHYMVSGDPFPTAARVVYTGEYRPLTPERREILRRWQRGFDRDAGILDMFQNEYLFREDSIEVWLAVQTVLEPSLKEEARPGQTITVLTMFLGGYRLRTTTAWLFLVNEFDAAER